METTLSMKKKKKKKMRSKTGLKTPKHLKKTYCLLCSVFHFKSEALDHVHSIQHHQEMDNFLGTVSCHHCQACNKFCMLLDEFAQHIFTPQHRANLVMLKARMVQPFGLSQIIDAATMAKLKQRNRKCRSRRAKLRKKMCTHVQTFQTRNSHRDDGFACVENKTILPQGTEATPEKPGKQSAPADSSSVHSVQSRRETHDFCYDHSLCATYSKGHVFRQNGDSIDLTSEDLPEDEGLLLKDSGVEPKAVSDAPVASTPMHNVGEMLWQIRRELGVREPCRADREARKKNPEWTVQKAAEIPRKKVPPASLGSAQVRTAVTENKAEPQRSSRRTSYASDRTEMVPSVRGNITSTQLKEKESSYELQNFMTSGGKQNPSWSEIYNQLKRSKQKKLRLGRKVVTPQPEPPVQIEDDAELPLSEGFQWESIPGSPVEPDPPAQDLVNEPPPSETASPPRAVESATMEPVTVEPATVELENIEQCENASQTVAADVKTEQPLSESQVKEERNCEERRHGSQAGRDPNEKTMKTESNNEPSRMDQLLAVSLREEDLSKSLDKVERSLEVARHVLQAAHEKVQQLLLLKAQFSTEVSSLRTKRIKILQGMKEGSPGDNASATAVVVDNDDTKPHLTHTPLKPETCQPAAGSPNIHHPSPLPAPAAASSVTPMHPSPEEPGSVVSDEVIFVDVVSKGRKRSAPRPLTRGVEFVEETPCESVVIIDESDQEDSLGVKANIPVPQEVKQENVEAKIPKCEPSAAASQVPVIPVETLAVGAFQCHSDAVHALQVHNGLLFTGSADNTARAYSLTSKDMVAVFEGHTDKINALVVSSFLNLPARLYTGSSDQTVRCWSLKTNKCLEEIHLPDGVLCLHSAWNVLFIGLGNGSVVSLDLRTQKPLDVFDCHGPRGISCLGTAVEGARRLLLVGSYDSTISIRDARNGLLLLRSLKGHAKTVLSMTVVNDLVFSGSSDSAVKVHNIHVSRSIMTSGSLFRFCLIKMKYLLHPVWQWSVAPTVFPESSGFNHDLPLYKSDGLNLLEATVSPSHDPFSPVSPCAPTRATLRPSQPSPSSVR
ncbi:uncharacterized protein znf106b isoform X1 [Synchiropus splendidus]|uniref:uncharacterized protein znf106b isoform X1 n=1 Tax=Synchiropus splendidus TaxID=270530 RepID=UPI00237D4BA5|nr:uncharacterized protein znf106b isoform X1 [Synchiropus splendidus]